MATYQAGVDLGTTWTAAAVHRDGRTAIVPLGERSAVVPSVVLLRADGTALVGEAAERRALSEPERVVREFKRRFGDTIPIIVGGSPYSAEALAARLLRAVTSDVAGREGGPPSRLMLTHPANWGSYKRELLDQVVRLAGLDPTTVGFLTEPEAAALSYASRERVELGEVVAVYDLGGGTFDAAILRRTDAGFTILGRPEGIERLGGIDFDAAVFAHVTASLGDALTALDPDDQAALMAVTRLRLDCVAAKEALSSDTDASIAVVLPTVQTEIRITRSELERLIRPALGDSIEALRRALRSASLATGDVSRVLLVGGSSRIPLVAQMVSSELNRPVAVDAHPKHGVALGAALAASGLLAGNGGLTSQAAPTPLPASPARPFAPPPPVVASPVPSATPAAPVTVAPASPPVPSAGGGGPVFDANRTMVAPSSAPSTPLPVVNPAKARPVPLAGRPPPGTSPGPEPAAVPSPAPSFGLTPPPAVLPPLSVPVVRTPAVDDQRTAVLPPSGFGDERTSILGPDDGFNSRRTSVMPGIDPAQRTAIYRPSGDQPGAPGGSSAYVGGDARRYPGPVGHDGDPARPPTPVPVAPARRPRGGLIGQILLFLLVVVVVAGAIVGAFIALGR